MYDEEKTNIDTLLDCFNNILPKLKFNIEKETDCKINFLDITISREPNKISIDIYRKPTYTDIIIPNDSCHPREHKMAAIHYLCNRMNTYQLSPEKQQKESINIQQILKRMNTILQSQKVHPEEKNQSKTKIKHSGLNSRTLERK